MQKRLLLSLASFFVSLTMQAQWSLSGNSNATTSSKLGTTNNVPVRLFANNVERIRVSSGTGFVGIGTTNPQQRLHVEGLSNQAIFVSTTAPSATSGSGMIGSVKALPTGAGQRLGYFLVGSRGGAENGYISAGFVGYAGGAWSSSSRPAYLTFETTPSGTTARVERMRIDANGKVGIGTSTPYAALDVTNATSTEIIRAVNAAIGDPNATAIYCTSDNGNGYGYGVQASGGYIGVSGAAFPNSSNGASYGVYGTVSGNTGVGTRYGVYGLASSGNNVYGVYGIAANGSSFNAAGYFNGAVYAGSYLSTSDRKFKKDIAPVKQALSQIMKLKPSTYQFKKEEYKGMHLPEGEQIGLIADEVKQVFPQLVQKAVQPAQYDAKDRTKQISPEVQYEAVNYQGLIPVLVVTAQEQQSIIEKQQQQLEWQQQQIDELKAMVSKLVQGSGAVSFTNASLGTATPNPVSGSATVSYIIPQDSRTAHIVVTDIKGSIIKQVNISSKGSGQVQLNTAPLAAGTYTYSLFVDGSKIDTKQLLVAR